MATDPAAGTDRSARDRVARVASDAFAPAPGETVADAVFPKGPLLRLLQAIAVLVAASLVPYVLPGLENYRYWERQPLVLHLLVSTLRGEATADAEPAAAGAPKSNDDDQLDDAELERMAGVHGAAGLAGGASETDDAATGLPGAPTGDDPLVVDDETLKGQSVWLEGDLEHGAPLFRAFAALARGRRSHVRIGHWGDSHIANDGITHVTRLLLHKRFGDGGHGFVLPQGRTEWYSHKGVTLTPSEGWALVNFLNGNAKDGAYGYGGVGLDGGPGEAVTWTTTGKTPWSHAQLYFRAKGRGAWQARVDGKAVPKAEFSPSASADLAAAWTVTEAPHAIQVKLAAGRARLFGIALERERGVVYDSLGEVGARGVRWKNADAAHLQATMALRKPDAVIINYGGNERLDKLAEATYVQRMNDVVALLKGGRDDVACLVFGPSDHGVREKGEVVSDPAIVKLIRWQRRVAKESNCLFFDTRALMGGDGSMGRWVKQGLGWSDYSHFTAKGERVMGQGTYRALLRGMRDWLRLHPEAARRR